MKPAMAALLTADDPIPAAGMESLDGEAVGNLLYADPDGRFHVLAVVFPEGTSSGVHHHGCWGVIGYLQGGDEIGEGLRHARSVAPMGERAPASRTCVGLGGGAPG